MKTATSKIVIKSPREIGLMRDAGVVVHRVLTEVERRVRPGVTTRELNEIAEEIISGAGGIALFLGVENPQARFSFPASICASVNEEVVHGIPGDRELSEGDIISVDCGVRLKGYCADSARTVAVGRTSADVRRLMETTRECLEIALEQMRPGVRWSRIARQMQAVAEERGFGVVREFVGHGIGRDMHEEPKIPNYYDRSQRGCDFELAAGMTLAVEPMITLGRPEVGFGDSARWSVITKDRSPAAHYEHTVAVTEYGVSVLTDGNENEPGGAGGVTS